MYLSEINMKTPLIGKKEEFHPQREIKIPTPNNFQGT